MKIAELTQRELNWVQPHALKMEYELRTEDAVIATVKYRSSFSSLATAASADGNWTFQQVGFWSPRIVVRANGTSSDLAVFKRNYWSGGGTLEFPDGRKYPIYSNFWMTQYEFKTETGESLISYKKISGVFHRSSKVEIHPLAKDIPEMPWMVLLGWYLRMQLSKESAAVASV